MLAFQYAAAQRSRMYSSLATKTRFVEPSAVSPPDSGLVVALSCMLPVYTLAASVSSKV